MARQKPVRKRQTRTTTPNLPVKVRQAFYEGIARECLNQAWMKLDGFRAEKRMIRRFRGKLREREGVSLHDIALSLSRSPGELSRWFQGQSPSWANLLLVMTALSAEWPHLQNLPDKQRRRFAGCMAALRVIHRLEFSSTPIKSDLKPSTIRCLLALNSEDDWLPSRRDPVRREQVIRRVADLHALLTADLDVADRDWGNPFACWLQTYANSVDEQIWE